MCQRFGLFLVVTQEQCVATPLQLPAELPDGAMVKVLARDIGYDEVEYQGKCYKVSMVLIDSGYRYAKPR